MVKKLNRNTALAQETRPVKILQFGEGNFLRAFVDWIVDILNERTDFNSHVEIIQPLRKGMSKELNDQEGLFHVILKGVQQGEISSNVRLVKCISKVINPYEDYNAFLQCGENPDLKFIVSNTTEAGIIFNPMDSNPSVLCESFPGKVTQLLFHRFKFFNGDPQKGLIFLPCELIEKNGDSLKKTILSYTEHWKLPPDFIRWIHDVNIFCNTLVDRIVPGFPKEDVQEIYRSVGYEDKLLVQAEPFHLWVIEGPSSVQEYFPASNTGLEIKFVNDLTPYRTRKVRILNGAHTALVPVAYLAGLRTVKDSVDDPSVGKFMRSVIFDEIIPTLDLTTDELHKFANDVIERFQNPFIKHELLSIALNSISKFTVRVLPTIIEYKERTGKIPEHLAYSLAALIRFYKGEWKGVPIPLNDSPEIIAFFQTAWQAHDTDVVARKVLANESLWGQDLMKIEGLPESVISSLIKMRTLNLVNE